MMRNLFFVAVAALSLASFSGSDALARVRLNGESLNAANGRVRLNGVELNGKRLNKRLNTAAKKATKSTVATTAPQGVSLAKVVVKL